MNPFVSTNQWTALTPASVAVATGLDPNTTETHPETRVPPRPSTPALSAWPRPSPKPAHPTPAGAPDLGGFGRRQRSQGRQRRHPVVEVPDHAHVQAELVVDGPPPLRQSGEETSPDPWVPWGPVLETSTSSVAPSKT